MYAITAENVSKSYRLYTKPSDRLKEVLFRRQYHQVFSALEDISFSVKKHETFGIIGDNGAGKSTLLKLLAGTIRPSEGHFTMKGQVAALLELGAGFHPEFTGRQNIYLNATLLGLKHEKIQSIEQDIIDFAELQDFIDRPVRTYSSGMYVRLAFSIATSVNPDILIIDEALSVGDQHFQKKCVDRMMKFREADKTILFCSHSLYFVSELCNRVMWLHQGKIMELGFTDNVVMAYEKWSKKKQENNPYPESNIRKSPIKINSIKVIEQDGSERTTAKYGDDLSIVLIIESQHPTIFHIGIGFDSISGETVFGVSTKGDGYLPIETNGIKTVTVRLPKINLINGAYKAFAFILDEHAMHIYDYKVSNELEVEKKADTYGWVNIDHSWEI